MRPWKCQKASPWRRSQTPPRQQGSPRNVYDFVSVVMKTSFKQNKLESREFLEGYRLRPFIEQLLRKALSYLYTKIQLNTVFISLLTIFVFAIVDYVNTILNWTDPKTPSAVDACLMIDSEFFLKIHPGVNEIIFQHMKNKHTQTRAKRQSFYFCSGQLKTFTVFILCTEERCKHSCTNT